MLSTLPMSSNNKTGPDSYDLRLYVFGASIAAGSQLTYPALLLSRRAGYIYRRLSAQMIFSYVEFFRFYLRLT